MLQLAEDEIELARETGLACGGAKPLQLIRVPSEQSAQDHQATLFAQSLRRADTQSVENEFGEALKGLDAQPRIASEVGTGEQLAFKLKGRLLGRQEDER
jgi:hypothetical protein